MSFRNALDESVETQASEVAAHTVLEERFNGLAEQSGQGGAKLAVGKTEGNRLTLICRREHPSTRQDRRGQPPSSDVPRPIAVFQESAAGYGFCKPRLGLRYWCLDQFKKKLFPGFRRWQPKSRMPLTADRVH